MRNYFILDGVDSRDYGVYISGQGTFSAPQKAYEFYNIPGRNGALIGNEKRLENILVTYEAFIYTNFDANIAAFRAFLLSRNGYVRLTDSYHPDEFRLACYTGPFEPTVEKKNDAGRFEITFTCMPQRYLLSGETEYTWVYGAESIQMIGRTLEVWGLRLDGETFNVKNTYSVGERGAQAGAQTPTNPCLLSMPSKEINISIDGTSAYSKTAVIIQNVNIAEMTADLYAGTVEVTKEYYDLPSSGWSYSGGVFSHANPTGASCEICSHYHPYSASNQNYSISMDSAGIQIWDSRFANVASFQSWLGNNTVRIVYVPSSTATGRIDEFTATFPSGWFTISSFFSELELAYSPDPIMINPTVFPSQPLLRIYGTGKFTLNDVEITISAADTYTDVDCELMDCYKGSVNKNQYVSFSTYDFPVLYPGQNTVELGTGISSVTITPRWWRV